jgi:exopolyphosphatase/guanosine-5'-triphosphate,3'-diphosphate pyrophosphatase
LNALQKHKQTIQSYQVDKTFAFATSAVRSADNGMNFVTQVKTQTGIHINIIDGDQEAELIYFGVRQAMDLGMDHSLIIDIGGGSTEFIIANKKGATWKKSYLLGSSRLMEKFTPHDPIGEDDIRALEKHFDTELVDLLAALNQTPVSTIIGSSGSFDTLAEMVIAHFDQEPNESIQTAYEFKLEQYHHIAALMLRYTYQERLNTPGMIPMRADLIVLACVLINYILKKINPEKMKLSTYALKEGVFETLNNDNPKWQESLL